MDTGNTVTQILAELSCGDTSAAGRLMPLVYDELRELAERSMRRERSDHTLQSTALVHEAYMRLVDQSRTNWKNRAHFFAVASQAIRRILVDHARSRNRIKRGGGQPKMSLDEALIVGTEPNTDLILLDDALTRLAEIEPEKARVVELRFFGGLTNSETAELLGVTTRTVERYWQFARAWLFREIAIDHDDTTQETKP